MLIDDSMLPYIMVATLGPIPSLEGGHTFGLVDFLGFRTFDAIP